MTSAAAQALLLLALGLSACSTPESRIASLERSLDRLVGRNFEELLGSRRSVLRLTNETAEWQDYEFRDPLGCAWTYRIRRSDQVIIQVRITSDRELCKADINRGTA